MNKLLVVGEDALCCSLAERLVEHVLPGWTLSLPAINTGGVTKLRASLRRYAEQARHVQPVFRLADVDGACAIDWLRQWRPFHEPTLIVRLAVNEAESWVLADRSGFAKAMQVPLNRVPTNADTLVDAKLRTLHLVANSGKRILREEMVAASDASKQGTGYNLHLCAFVRTRWDASAAGEASPSLRRAMRHLRSLDSGGR